MKPMKKRTIDEIKKMFDEMGLSSVDQRMKFIQWAEPAWKKPIQNVLEDKSIMATRTAMDTSEENKNAQLA